MAWPILVPPMPSQLFTPFALRGLTLPNRVAVAPMCQYSAVDGVAGDWHLMHYGSLALGGFGHLMFEATGVQAEGRITHGCLGLYSDACVKALDRIIKFCRTHGPATTLGIQIGHAGAKASTHIKWIKNGAPLGPTEDPWQTVSSSTTQMIADSPLPRSLDRDGMNAVRDHFVDTARRAARVDFDLLELHGAHGYLIHQFLSPLSNTRNDEYGGPIANRMRFPLEIFTAVRAVWPESKPLGIRISATDHVPGGWTIDDSTVFAHELKALGCDFIDVSSGGASTRQKITLGPGYQVALSAHIRKAVRIPTMSVGMIVDPHQAEAIVANGEADLVELARGALFDPRWAWHAAETLGAEAPYPLQYERSKPALWPDAFPAHDLATMRRRA